MAQKKIAVSKNQAIGIGVGLTAAAATLAGAYFLYGSKNAAKNRKVVKGWMLKAKGEVLTAVENAQNMTKEEYEKLVSTVGAGYLAAKEMSEVELAAFTKEMMTHWKDLTKTVKPKKKALKKVVTKAVSAAKKAAAAPAKKTAKKTK